VEETIISQPHQVMPAWFFIDRTISFCESELFDKGWTIAEEDFDSLLIEKIVPEQILLVKMTGITQEERSRRFREANHVPLDVKIFQLLWENRSFIPEQWKKEEGGETRIISFDGTVFENDYYYPRKIGMYWAGKRWKHIFFPVNSPGLIYSAVIKK